MLPVIRRTSSARASARGFSLVELMVGIAVGMFVVAAAALMTSSILSDNRRLLLETQLQQDLRAAADIVARDLRRSGYWASARDSVPPPSGGNVVANPNAALVADRGNSKISYNYDRRLADESISSFSLGFRLSNGKLQSCQSSYNVSGCTSGWQDLTDDATVRITSFDIRSTRDGTRAQADNGNSLVIPCTQLCTNGSTTCWPRVSVRELVISISGESPTDNKVTRSLELSVRPRNDLVELSGEAPANQSCPG